MIQQKRPYLIEGLDCSGKKSVAQLVKAQLENEFHVPVKLVVGSFVKSPIKTFDRIISNPSRFSKNSRIVKNLKQIIYTIAPVIDFYFYIPSKNKITIKISSHLRAEAKALIDKDLFMIKYFKKFRNVSVKYQGAVLLTSSFETRILRHRADVGSDKTKKDETKRFYQNNQQLFQEWNNALTDLMKHEISSVKIIENDNINLEYIADEIINHIKSVYGQ